MLAVPASADPSPTSTLTVSYGIAFWNITLGHANYEGLLGANTYSAKAHFETNGVIGAFWKSVIDATVNGGIGAHFISPATYDSYSRNRGNPLQRVKVTFGSEGSTVLADPIYDTTKYPVSEVQKKDAVDPMSAATSILTGAKADANHPCGTGAQIFDGRRRYDLNLTYLKDEPVTLNNGLFSGSAHLCEIHYDAIAGYPQRIVSSRRAPPKMFADFVDVPAQNAPGGRYVVPVKLWSEMSLGTMTVTVDTIKVDGAAPSGIFVQN
jgi:hypothetical protein